MSVQARIRRMIREEICVGPIFTLAGRLEKRFLELVQEIQTGGSHCRNKIKQA